MKRLPAVAIASGETERAGLRARRVHSISFGRSRDPVFVNQALCTRLAAIYIAQDLFAIVHELLLLSRLLVTRCILISCMPTGVYGPRQRHSSRIMLPLLGATFAPLGDEFCHMKLR